MICSEMVGRKWFSGHTHLENSRIQYHFSRKDGVFSYPPPVLPSQSSSNGISTNLPKSPAPSSSGTKINPAVLFIIVILAVIFFISGLLHLLVRFLSKKSSSQSNRNLEDSTSDAIQRQLQQLFNLHDSGLDQAFIDALPIFSYKEILGPKKEHFDCPVCLCEFIETDQLRLLTMCGHAFHLGCIDTWLLSNSTCPLCRGTLLNPGFENPIFDYDDFREEDGFSGYGDKRIEIEEVGMEKGGFPVRLGKFRKLDSGEGGEINGESSSSSRLDTRRCYSMGSYQYVVGDAKLRVALSRDKGLRDENKGSGRDFGDEGKKISIGTKKDSYSVSKIWLWSKKGKFVNSSIENLSPPPYLDLSWMNRK